VVPNESVILPQANAFADMRPETENVFKPLGVSTKAKASSDVYKSSVLFIAEREHVSS
jgi:hypothetical protein